jgi:hypothetical protein
LKQGTKFNAEKQKIRDRSRKQAEAGAYDDLPEFKHLCLFRKILTRRGVGRPGPSEHSRKPQLATGDQRTH